jgi:ketosteroid isomerase-like protein
MRPAAPDTTTLIGSATGVILRSRDRRPWETEPVSQNVNTVKRIYEDWERGDFRSTDWADPEIRFSIPGPDPEVQGLEKMGETWFGFLQAYNDLSLEATEYFERDNVVVTRQLFYGKGRASGIPVDEIMGGCVFELRDGKVVRFAGYTSLDDALADAGITPEN